MVSAAGGQEYLALSDTGDSPWPWKGVATIRNLAGKNGSQWRTHIIYHYILLFNSGGTF